MFPLRSRDHELARKLSSSAKDSLLNSGPVLSGLAKKPIVFPFLAFLVPVLVRTIPELLMGPFVTGFDVLAYYIPNTLLWLGSGVGFWNFVSVAPLFYMLVMAVTAVGVPIVVSLKLMAPLFLGFLGVAVFFYANKTLAWSSRKSLLVALFATLYFVALRVSWDMLRSELGLILLFVTLILLGKQGSSLRNSLLLSVTMLSVVLSHQLVAVIMFFVVLVTTIRWGIDRKISDVRRLLLCSVPATFLFLVMVWANYAVSPDFALLSGVPVQSSEGWNALFGFTSYTDFMVDTLGFLLVCYLPLLPLLLWGRKGRLNLQLKAWMLWILIVLAFAIVSPLASFAALPYRWVLLLVFPLSFYAAEGFAAYSGRRGRAIVCSVLVVLSVGFLVLPSSLALPYFSIFPFYGPKSMLHNTIPLGDCEGALNSLGWLKSNMEKDSRLLVHDAFAGFAALTLDRSQLVFYGHDDPAGVAKAIAENGSTSELYLVWWVDGNGWYGQPTVSSVFDDVYWSGRIAVFRFDSGIDGDGVISVSG